MYRKKPDYPDPDTWDELIDNFKWFYLNNFELDGWFGKYFLAGMFLPGILWLIGLPDNIFIPIVIFFAITIGLYFFIMIILSPTLLSEYLRKNGIPKIGARIITLFVFIGGFTIIYVIGLLS